MWERMVGGHAKVAGPPKRTVRNLENTSISQTLSDLLSMAPASRSAKVSYAIEARTETTQFPTAKEETLWGLVLLEEGRASYTERVRVLQRTVHRLLWAAIAANTIVRHNIGRQ